MKRYNLDFHTNENGIKIFSENSNKLIIWDIPKSNSEFIKNEIQNKNSQLTGIYLLIFKDEEDENQKNEIYIGQSNDVSKRTLEHIREKNKKFNRVIIIYSDSNSYKLDKDQTIYIENKLISHFKLLPTLWKNEQNKKNGDEVILPFIKKEELENHINFILFGLKLLDYNVKYEEEKKINDSLIEDEIKNHEKKSIKVYIKSPLNNEKIIGNYIPDNENKKGNIWLEKGTIFKTRLKIPKEKYAINFIKNLKKYKNEGKIDWNEKLNPINDIICVKIIKRSFFTPSAIAQLILGLNSTNGYTKWKDENGTFINEYRNFNQ